ncbi:MAG: TetR/AcrR family transcriptional regulator [Rhizobiales bacterium]|nr:TetR/AcrR family transcriptional regulator [Hyphomicrobiales bacterium]
MEKPPSKKEQTKEKILIAASQNFRSNGYSGIGVDGIAKAAGVTSGAFYSHFGSKDGAFDAALIAGLNEVIEGIPQFQSNFGKKWIEEFADYYLSQKHQNDLACGCAMTTLSPEVVRATNETQATYEKMMSKIIDLAADGLEGGSKEDKRSRAWAMLSILIGGLTMARAVKTKKTTNEIAQSIKASAINAAGKTKETP